MIVELKYPQNLTLMNWNISSSFVNNYFNSKSDHFSGGLLQQLIAVSCIHLFALLCKDLSLLFLFMD
jgi:hypothetical protein